MTSGASGGRAARARDVTLIVLAGALLVLPALVAGLPDGHDTLTHLQWYHHFSRQLADGEPYPRWLAGMNGGFGSPTMFFYGPLPYYATSVLGPLFPDDALGSRALGVSAAIALIGSGLAAYGWLAGRRDRRAAMIGALAYMALPYHLVVDLYDRAAFAELWAFVWLPLLLFLADRIAKEERIATPCFALAYAALVATHLPTTLLFSPLLVAYATFRSRPAAPADPPPASPPRGIRAAITARPLALVLAAMALGAALASLHLVPALASRSHVLLAETPADARHFTNNFLFDPGHGATYGEYLGWLERVTLVTLAILAACFAIPRVRSGTRDRSEGPFWIAVGLVAAVMTTPLARPIWEALPALQSIQFPWRFHTLLSIALAATFADAFARAHGRDVHDRAASRARLPVGALSAIVIALAAWCVYIITVSESRAFQLAKSRDTRLLRVSVELGLEGRQFRPRWANLEIFTLTPLADLARRAGTAALVEGEGEVRSERRGPRAFALHANVSTEATILVQHFYYPGWTARTTPDGARLATGPSRPDGLIAVRVPPGRHEISLRLEPTTAERAGAMLSGIAGALVLTLVVSASRGPRRASRPS